MKHAGPAALDRLAPLLAALRTIDGLVERSRGVFYWRARAFLHFHEDPSGLFADIRGADGNSFDRLRVDTPEGARTLLAQARSALAPPASRPEGRRP